MPVMRIAELVGTNFSDIFPNCWMTVKELLDYGKELWLGANSDFNTFLISYLFTQMGYALTYRRIITKIDENNENQAYEANMAQYGQIINQLFLSITVRPLMGISDDVAFILN